MPTKTLRSPATRRIAIFVSIISVAGLVLVYPPVRIASLLLPAWSPPAWLMLVLIALPLGSRLLNDRTGTAWVRAISATMMTWLGICFIALTLLLPTELLLITNLLTPQHVGLGLLTLLAAISLYSFYNARQLHVFSVELTAPDHIRNQVRGQTLVQISDVHIGSRQPGLLRPIVAKINALNPDYVAITGDLIDMAHIGEEDLQPLAQLQAPTLFCIGNHERYVDLEEICQRLTNLGIQVIRNGSVKINEVQFIGIDDAERKDQLAQHLPNITPANDAYRVLLYHRPTGAEDAAKWGADLMLTGHTHRGQIFPFNFLVKRVFPELYRSYEYAGMRLYVSPGTGTWGPVLRLGSKCEITQFRLM